MTKTLLSCLILAAAASAQAGTLLPPSAGDQRPQRLQPAAPPAMPLERAPVSFAWSLDPATPLAAPAPFQAESREYWTVVEAADLQRGHGIQTTAPGAVVRISPERGAAPVDATQLRVAKGGRAIARPEAFRRQASAAQLRAAGMDVGDGSIVVQLAETHGAGRFDLLLPQASGRYLVQVYEPNSPFVLQAQADRRSVLAGDRFEVAGALRHGQAALAGGAYSGELVAPDGRRFPLAFDGGRARVDAPVQVSAVPGLWEVTLYAGAVADGQPVQREVRTAVEVVAPTARFAGGYAFDPAALRVGLPVEVAAAGRYEARGTLYATGPAGDLRPVAQAQAAAWLDPGHGRLSLGFAGYLPPGHGAPYELRDLQLLDQGRLGTLETRARALRETGSGRPAPVRERRTRD